MNKRRKGRLAFGALMALQLVIAAMISVSGPVQKVRASIEEDEAKAAREACAEKYNYVQNYGSDNTTNSINYNNRLVAANNVLQTLIQQEVISEYHRLLCEDHIYSSTAEYLNWAGQRGTSLQRMQDANYKRSLGETQFEYGAWIHATLKFNEAILLYDDPNNPGDVMDSLYTEEGYLAAMNYYLLSAESVLDYYL